MFNFNMKLKYLVITLFISLSLPLFSDNIEFIANAPNEVATEQSFRISYTINKNVNSKDINFPDFSGLYVLSGPNVSTSTNISVINGKTTREIKNTFTFYVKGINEGGVTIGPATVKIDSKTYKSNSLSINIIKGNGLSNQNSSNNNSGNSNNYGSRGNTKASGGISKDDIFITTNLSKRNVYVGEAVVYTHNVFTKYNLAGFGDIKFPSYTGFWREQNEVKNISLQSTTYNNDRYYSSEIFRDILFPQYAGELKIAPTEIEVIARVKSQQQGSSGFGSFFDDFFSTYQNVPVLCSSKEHKINVKPLPTIGKPDDFFGAVGDYSISATIDKNEIKANDAITITYKISGTGNIKMIDKINPSFPVDFEVYEPNIKQNIKVLSNNVNGTKEFEYVVIPRIAGNYKINPLSFSYFDPKKEKYITLKTPEFEIKVEESDNVAETEVYSGVEQKDIVTLNEDIRYLKTNTPLFKKKNYMFFGSPIFLSVFLAILIIYTIVLLIFRAYLRRKRDIEGNRKKKADKVAKQRLSKAKSLIDSTDDSKFYEEISNALWQYISDKFNVKNIDLNREFLQNLDKKNSKLTKDEIDKYIAVLDEAEYIRFSPNKKDNLKSEVYEKAVDVIKTFYNKLK